MRGQCEYCHKDYPTPTTPGVVKRIHCEISPDLKHCITYDYAGSTLRNLYPVKDVRNVSKGILYALSLLHSPEQPTNHNINPSVIVMSLDNNFGFLDTVLSYRDTVPNESTDHINHCSAPELLKQMSGTNGPACDVFSIGCCIYFLITGRNPFGQTANDIHKHAIDPNFQIDFELINKTTNLKEYEKFLVFDLIKEMLNIDPKKRISIQNALDHPFFWDTQKINNFLLANYPHLEQLSHYSNDQQYLNLAEFVDEEVKQSSGLFLIKILDIFPSALMSLFNVIQKANICTIFGGKYHHETPTTGSRLLSGYFYNQKKNRTDVTLIKDSDITSCGYCVDRVYNKSKITHDRLYCGMINNEHWVVYNQFECTLRSFAEHPKFEESSLPIIFKDVLKRVQSIRKLKLEQADFKRLCISPDTICIVNPKQSKYLHGGLLDTAMCDLSTNYCAPEISDHPTYTDILKSDVFSVAACILYAYTGIDRDSINTTELCLMPGAPLYFLKNALEIQPDNRVSIDGFLNDRYFWSKSEVEAYNKKIKTLKKSTPFQDRLITDNEFFAVSDSEHHFFICRLLSSHGNNIMVNWLAEEEEGKLTHTMGRVYNTTTACDSILKSRILLKVEVKKIDMCRYELPHRQIQLIENFISKTHEISPKRHLLEFYKYNKKTKYIQ